MDGILIKTLLSLIAIIGLMLLILFVVKKITGISSKGGNGSVQIDVLGVRNFHPRRSVYVLHVLDKIIIVGITDNSMNILSEFDDDKYIKELNNMSQEEHSTSAGIHSSVRPFSSLLKKYMTRGSKVKLTDNNKKENIGYKPSHKSV